MKSTTPVLPFILLLSFTATTQAQINNNTNEADTSVVWHGTDTLAGFSCWTNKNSSLVYNNQLDSMGLLQFGETYLEITDKKAIWIMCRDGQKSLDIMWDKSNKKINIMNNFHDSAAIISMIEGKAKVKFLDSIYEVKAPQTLYIDYDNTVTIQDTYDPRLSIEWTKAKHRTFNRLPIYAVFNEIARQYKYGIVYIRKDRNITHTYLDYNGTLEETLQKTIRETIPNIKYQIQDKTIFIY